MSAWSVLFGSGCDQSLITMTGFDHKPYRYILRLFEAPFEMMTTYRKHGVMERKGALGPKRTLSARDCLGLSLVWYRTSGTMITICMLFFITFSVCSLFIRFSRRILVNVLSKNALSMVRMPTANEVSEYQKVI